MRSSATTSPHGCSAVPFTPVPDREYCRAISVNMPAPITGESGDAEKKVSYRVDGRQFEGMIVYDETIMAKRPVVFLQPDWKACAPIRSARRAPLPAGLYRADGRHVRLGLWPTPKTVDELRAGMLAVHNNLPFTLACGGKAYDALSAEAQKLGVANAAKVLAIGYCAGGGYALEQARAGADSRRWSCSMSPIRTRSWPARLATSKAACSRSMARRIR